MVVSHPSRQHSHQLALALRESGILAGYLTGVPTRRPPASLAPNGGWARYARYEPLRLPRECVRLFPVAPLLTRGIGRWLPPAQRAAFAHGADALFDAWAARKLRQTSGLAGVVAYENGALRTFREAKRQGLTTILDAASIHHRAQDELHTFRETEAAHARIVRRKDGELAEADYVLCLSRLAANTYRAAGIAEERLRVVPLGVDLSRFRPSGDKPSGAPLAFAFAGSALSHHKGGDLLLSAFAAVRAVVPAATLHLFGAVPGGWDAARREGVIVHGSLPQSEMARRLARADCLVLPSLHEGFGMVVVEAMASGLPVIISDRVGAKDAVDEGVHGWIVPARDGPAVEARMRWCAENPDEVRRRAGSVRERAQEYSWARYRERVARVIRELVDVPASTG